MKYWLQLGWKRQARGSSGLRQIWYNRTSPISTQLSPLPRAVSAARIRRIILAGLSGQPPRRLGDQPAERVLQLVQGRLGRAAGDDHQVQAARQLRPGQPERLAQQPAQAVALD